MGDASSSDQTPDDEGERDSSVEVEPEEFSAPKAAPAKHHLPPVPPSVRVRGGTSSLTVTGEPKLARDLMTRRVFTIGPDDVIARLEEQMQAFRFRHLPVVEDHKLVGLITHSDLLHASSSFLSERAPERDELIHQTQARRIMQTELLTVRPTDSLEEVAELMWEAKVGCVLVTTEDAELLGIITEGDFIRLAHHLLTRTT